MLCLVKHGKMLDFSLIGSPEQVKSKAERNRFLWNSQIILVKMREIKENNER